MNFIVKIEEDKMKVLIKNKEELEKYLKENLKNFFEAEIIENTICFSGHDCFKIVVKEHN